MSPTDATIPLGVNLPAIASPQQAQAQALTIQDKRLELQERQQKLVDAARARGEQDAVNKLYVTSADPTGKVDPQTFLNALGQNGLGHLVPTYQKSFDEARTSAATSAKAQADATEAKNKAALAEADYFGGVFNKVKASGYDPVILHSELDAAQAPGHDVAPFQAALKQLPIQQAVDMGIQGSNQQRELILKEAAAQKPVSLAPGASLVRPMTGEVVAQGGGTPTESKSMMLDGKPAEVIFDPRGKPGEQYSFGGKPVEASRLKPIPPASIQIQNQLAGQTLPDFALTAKRPTAEEGNTFDTRIGMTPNGLYQAAITNMQTGQLPPIGRGGDLRSQNVRAAITSKIGAIAADAGMDEPTLRALYKANAGSLGQQQKFSDAAQAFLSTADKNSALLEPLLSKIPDTGSPLLNKPLRALDQRAIGNVDLAQFRTYLTSVQNEYAKIITNPNLSGQLTDSARQETQQLVDPNATVAQILGSLDALKKEGTNRLASIGDQIQRIQARMQNGGAAPAAAGGSTLQANSTHRVVQNGVTYNVTTDPAGKVISAVKVP